MFLALTLVLLAHLIGLATAVAALMSSRTPQGTVAWLLALLTLPYLAVPAYWVFGRRRFEGYMVSRRREDTSIREMLTDKLTAIRPHAISFQDERGGIRAVEELANLPVLGGNEVDLLIDGEEIFESMFRGIAEAQEYILIQFYIVKDDGVGRAFKDRLAARAREGIDVRFLFDEIGSYGLASSYKEELADAGVRIHPFHSTKGPGNRFQINFRNHRKVMVVDGTEGWIGGINVGDEYLGLDPDRGQLRETHLRIRGPSVMSLQLSFLEDWHWATDELPDLPWVPRDIASESDVPVLILPSGPADPMETGSLMVQHAIHSAVERIWISTPYFVPDGGVMAALRLAALRGVDVRILVPDKSDHRLVGLASFPFVEQLLDAGVQFFRFEPGFLHAKTLLLDRAAAALGTMNMDNRSFRLNFEITALVIDTDFADEVATMLEADFSRSRQMTSEEVSNRPFRLRVASRAAALFAPVL